MCVLYLQHRVPQVRFIRFNVENELSADAVETGSVARILYKINIFGKISGLNTLKQP